MPGEDSGHKPKVIGLSRSSLSSRLSRGGFVRLWSPNLKNTTDTIRYTGRCHQMSTSLWGALMSVE